MTTSDDADAHVDREPEPGRRAERVPTGVCSRDLGARARLVESPVGKLALVRSGDSVVAIDAWCPHLDGPLWEGATSRGEVACPWHGWRYSLATGRCTWAPQGDAQEAAETGIRVLPTETDSDGQIFVLIVDEGLEPPEGSRLPPCPGAVPEDDPAAERGPDHGQGDP